MSADGAVSARSSSSSSLQAGEDEKRPVSIAALRSKFENLAAGGDGNAAEGGSHSRRGSQTQGLGVKKVDTSSNVLVNGSTTEAAKPASRPTTPTPRVPSQSSAALFPQSDLRPPARSQPPSSPAISPKPRITATKPTPQLPDDPQMEAPRSTSPSVLPDSVSSSPKPIRRPAPAVPPKLASDGSTSASSDQGSDDGNAMPLVSVKSLKERFSAPSKANAAPVAESSAMGARAWPRSPLPRSPSLDEPKQPPDEPTGRRPSAPFIKRTSTGGTISSPILSPQQGQQIVSLPLQPAAPDGILPMQRNKSPPPAPPSRAPSPKPPEPDRATKPLLRNSPSPTPPSRTTSSPNLQVEQPPPAAAPTAPPQLPARKATLSSPDPAAPPPLPGNRPIASPPSNVTSTVPTDPPPRLPVRERASTVNKADSVPPRLPSRNATLAVPASSGAHIPIRAPTIPPSSPQRVRDISEGHQPPPLPMRSAMAAETYQPPPPPLRTAAGTPSTQRQETKSSTEMDSDDEEEDEPAPLTGLTTSAKRMLEDFPDATHANRRPPRFVPDVRLASTYHVHAFAVFGRHVCTGSHHVRVYDTLMSEVPIFIVDLRETGLELRVKDPKVTAMCFRPAACEVDEGRYLWCGTKDGHLWELDIKTGEVTDTRSFVHASAVIGIFRHHNWLISLEESGKAHVFEVGKREDSVTKEDVQKIPQLCRTIRITDKFNFAKLVCGRLWVSSGPANRSTTNAASKGPTIRVYEPCSPGTMAAAKSLFTTEWTGTVTSATMMPLRPNTVFLGHEGGFVSVWSAMDLACVQVLKISSSDILALEGVGESLWAGNRKGQIHVYNIDEKPWQVTNVWIAHPDHPVQTLLVDPWSVEHAGRFTLWSLARDALRAWDGLRSVDWVDHEMNARQPDYSSLRDIKLLVCSWNIDSAKPTELSGSEANSRFFDELLHSVDSPDIIVFGFQEVIPLTDKKLTAKTILFGGKNKDAGATADKVSRAYRQWLDKLQSAVRFAYPDESYVKVHSESLVGLFTCVFVKASHKDSLRDINVCTVKRGIGGIYGNKGAIVARMVIDDTSICFINVHLAAGQSQRAARTADLGGIMEDRAIFPAAEDLPFVNGGDGTAILDHELVVLNGDLNYRIDQRRENVLSSIEAGEWAYLLEHDQLRKEMRGNHAFRLRSFEEAQICFPPTYKYNSGTNEYDSSEKRRIPAWCDRILWNRSPHIESINYRRYEPTVSDHKPVSAGFKLTIKAVDAEKMNAVRREIGVEWGKKEAEVLEMMARAYETLL